MLIEDPNGGGAGGGDCLLLPCTHLKEAIIKQYYYFFYIRVIEILSFWSLISKRPPPLLKTATELIFDLATRSQNLSI